MKRVIILLLDSVGIGELPDASLYGDEGSNTLCNTAKAVGSLHLPNLGKLGLSNIVPVKGVKREPHPRGSFGKMAEKSKGKDSITGHWELMGLTTNKFLPTYPGGFPREMIKKFEKAIGKKTLGGYPVSGTVIIEKLGREHIKTGFPIIYTSADSVFQIACHKDVIPLTELYKMCEIARKLFPDVGRIIARPFIGEPGSFKRTPERKDYSLEPSGLTLFDLLKEKGIPVIGIGKIDYLFANRGIRYDVHTKNNKNGMRVILDIMQKEKSGLIFANLVDFDQLWGHRNDVNGYARGLEEFDEWLPKALDKLERDDILFITADHGNDPTTPSTDHSREYVPILATGKLIKAVNLGIRESFADLGATIGEYFGIRLKNGKSFLGDILHKKN
jgi:phosphopentomutase